MRITISQNPEDGRCSIERMTEGQFIWCNDRLVDLPEAEVERLEAGFAAWERLQTELSALYEGAVNP